MEGMDVLYYHKEEKDRIRQMTGDLFKFVRKQLKHYRQKLPKLLDAMQESAGLRKWREYGDLLYAYGKIFLRHAVGNPIHSLDQSKASHNRSGCPLRRTWHYEKMFSEIQQRKKGQGICWNKSTCARKRSNILRVLSSS